MNRERGEWVVEYAFILVLAAVIVCVILALIGPRNQTPPAVDAPMMDIVHYCDGQSAYTRTINKITTTHYDSDKFRVCLQRYEYRISR